MGQEIRDATGFAFVREDLAAVAFCVVEAAGIAPADFCLARAFCGCLLLVSILGNSFGRFYKQSFANPAL